MRARGELTAILLALCVCAACPLLGSDEEPAFEGSPTASSDRVPVVDDVGEFDPSEAVDDDDGLVVLDDTDDPTDRAAFADEDGERSPAATESAENEREEGDAKPGKKREPVADEGEVAAREERRERQVERAEEGGGDEDEEKAELAENPPPEPAPDSEGPVASTLDYVLETLLVAIAAALVAGGVVFARSHPRIVTVGALAIGVMAWFVTSQVD